MDEAAGDGLRVGIAVDGNIDGWSDSGNVYFRIDHTT